MIEICEECFNVREIEFLRIQKHLNDPEIFCVNCTSLNIRLQAIELIAKHD